MRILFIVPTYKPAYVYGGATVVISKLAESIAAQGHEITVYTTNGNGKEELEVETNRETLVDGVRVFYFRRYTGDHSHLAPAFWWKIFRNVKDFDIVHLHSWWNPSIVLAGAVCKLRGVIPVLSPHGMFCDWVLYTHNRRKKQLLHYFTKSILQATFLHVSTQMEWLESQNFLKKEWNGVVIPNLINLERFKTPTRKPHHPFVIGFISRIDSKKGLDILIEGLSKVRFDYVLKIAGTGDSQYLNYLRQVAMKSGNADKIDWVGWKNTTEKYDFYSSLDLFALTSLNENFAVVVLESLSTGTPVVVSNKVGLANYVEEKDLGWVTNIATSDEVAATLENAFQDRIKRERIQLEASATIHRDFDPSVLVGNYLSFYGQIVKLRGKSTRAERPSLSHPQKQTTA